MWVLAIIWDSSDPQGMELGTSRKYICGVKPTEQHTLEHGAIIVNKTQINPVTHLSVTFPNVPYGSHTTKSRLFIGIRTSEGTRI